MTDPVWVPSGAVVAMQGELIAQHGGLPGQPRSADLVTALARPGNLLACASARPSLARLAAAYGYAVARGRCFRDGNVGVALAIMDVFLQLNGQELAAPEAAAASTLARVAAGDLTEGDLADWIAAHLGPR